jgi:hypothetical protein
MVDMILLVEQADAQQVVPGMAAAPDLTLFKDEEHGTTMGVAFVPDHPDWLVSAEYYGFCVNVSNIRTGALICKFGEKGCGEGQFDNPYGIAVTADSSYVLVADASNDRVQVLKLVVSVDDSSVHLEFSRIIGQPEGNVGQLHYPMFIALMPVEGGQETMLVTENSDIHRVSHFALDGTFIRVFAKAYPTVQWWTSLVLAEKASFTTPLE